MKTRPILSKLVPYTPGERRPGAIKLSSNENPYGCSPAAATALRNAVEEAHIYPDGTAPVLKNALAAQHNVSPDQIILGNGSDEVLTLIAATYLDPGDSVLIGRHTFSQYEFATHLFDGRVITIPMPDLTFEPELFLRELDQSVRIVFLCSPNNPTGIALTKTTLQHFIEQVPPDVLVVMDHAYIDYQESSDSCDALEHLPDHRNLIVLRTFSKIHGLAALRIGYGLASPERIAEMERVRSPFNVNSFAQHAAIASLGAPEFPADTFTANRHGKIRMANLFDELKIPYLRSEANFITITAPQGGRDFAEALAQQGITVRALNSFGLPDMVRITIGTPEQINKLESAVRRIIV